MTIDPTSPHAELLLEITQEDFARWQHHPISRAYNGYLDDLMTAFRGIAVDILEAGGFRLNDPHEDRNPDVVRGKLLLLNQLRRISLPEIQGFYGKAEPEESEQADR